MTEKAETMTEKAETGPAWGYRKDENGEVESKLFADGKLPRGWQDTPAKLKGAKNADNG